MKIEIKKIIGLQRDRYNTAAENTKDHLPLKIFRIKPKKIAIYKKLKISQVVLHFQQDAGR
jgi:hypothetical protein